LQLVRLAGSRRPAEDVDHIAALAGGARRRLVGGAVVILRLARDVGEPVGAVERDPAARAGDPEDLEHLPGANGDDLNVVPAPARRHGPVEPPVRGQRRAAWEVADLDERARWHELATVGE